MNENESFLTLRFYQPCLVYHSHLCSLGIIISLFFAHPIGKIGALIISEVEHLCMSVKAGYSEPHRRILFQEDDVFSNMHS